MANGVTNRPISKLYPLEVNVGMDATEVRSQEQDVKSSSPPCPRRLAAPRASAGIGEWNKILQGPEDVVD